MLLKESQINIINLLSEHEKAIGELYGAYANKFPEHNNFWLGLVKEEMEHSGWLSNLTEKIKEGHVYFNQGRFAEEAIKTSLAEVKRQINKTGGELSLIEALSTSCYFETALIEKKYFEVFEGDSVELKHTLIKLSDATKNHQNKIKEFLDKERKKSGIAV